MLNSCSKGSDDISDVDTSRLENDDNIESCAGDNDFSYMSKQYL